MEMVHRLFVTFSICYIPFAASREISARLDICRRMPQLAICTQRHAADASPIASIDRNHGGDSETATETLRSEYCQQFEHDFQYYCQGPGRRDQKAEQLCPTYSELCGVSAATAGQNSAQKEQSDSEKEAEQKLSQICLQYQPMAITYCTGPATERGDIKTNCDRYRSNCGEIPIQDIGTPRKSNPGCARYQKLYFSKCASRTPSTPQETTFCRDFASSCGPDDLVPQIPDDSEGSEEQSGSVLLPPPETAPSQSSRSAPSPSSLLVPTEDPPPINTARGTQVGNIAGTSQQTGINPLSGVNTGRSVNAGPVGVKSGSGVDFGQLIPGGLSNIPGLGRRRRRVFYRLLH